MPNKRGPHGEMHGKARKVGDHEPAVLLRHMGEQIKEHRLAHDVSLDELSAATGIPVGNLCNIEQCKVRRRKGRHLGPTAYTIIRIALALGVRPYELLP